MIAWLLCAGVAAAQAPIVTGERALSAPVDDVYRVAGDVGLWGRLWTFGRPGGPETGVVVRGRALAPNQDLRWSGASGSGQVLVHDVEPPNQIVYEWTWSRRSLLDGVFGGVPDHVGNVRIDPTDNGSVVRWDLYPSEPDDRSWAVGRVQRDLARTLDRLVAVVADVDALPPLPAEPPGAVRDDHVVLWRGFHHRWTYNHRINRNGDHWSVPTCAEGGCVVTAAHAAASGSGADRATYDSSATVLSGPGVAGWYGEVVLWFDGREGDLLEDRDCVRLPPEVAAGPAVLRGWDLDAIGDADSLWAMSVAVERRGDEVCATGGLRMACRTPECKSGTRTTYSLDVPFVVATGVDATPQRVEHTHAWEADDLRDEPDPASGRVSVEVPAVASRPAAVGVSGVSVALGEPQHLRGFDVAVGAATRDPATGAVRADVDLFVVQWGPVEIAPLTVAQFAEAGEAHLGIDLVVLQPATGCVVDVRAEGVQFWGGQSEDASVDTAVARQDVAFQPCAR